MTNYKFITLVAVFMSLSCSTVDDGSPVEGLDSTVSNPDFGQYISSNGLPPIYEHETLSFNGKLFTLGGADRNGTIISFKTSVYSSPTGKVWTKIAGNMPQKYGHSAVVFNNKMWMIGGISAPNSEGVWSSSDGAQWTKMSDHPGLFKIGHTTVVFNNQLFMLGGYHQKDSQQISTADYPYNSPGWSSFDGVNWTPIPDLNYPLMWHASIVFDNKIYVVGGFGQSQFTSGSIAGYSTWVLSTSDGINWTTSTSNGGFMPVAGHSLHVYDGKMWLVGGHNGNDYAGFERNSIYFSENGLNWTQFTPDANFSPRGFHTVTEHDGSLMLIGGIGHNTTAFKDIWLLN